MRIVISIVSHFFGVLWNAIKARSGIDQAEYRSAMCTAGGMILGSINLPLASENGPKLEE